MGNQPFEPTPDEIASRAASIRDGWTDAEFFKRAGIDPAAWQPPRAVDPDDTEIRVG